MSKPVEVYGVKFELPDTWSVRVFPPSVDGEERVGLNIHAVSMAFAMDDDSAYGSALMGTLGALDIGCTLRESYPHKGSGVLPHQGIWANAKPQGLTVKDFNPATLQVTRGGQLGLQRRFTINERPMELFAVLGSEGVPSAQLRAFNDWLESFQAAESESGTDYSPS